MGDRIKVPSMTPEGNSREEIGAIMDVIDSKEPWAEYFSKSGVLGVFQLNDFNQYYFSLVKDTIAPVFNKVITNLLKKKDFLALQLNHEFGNIDEKDYLDEEAKYLSEPQKLSIEKLKNEIEILYHFSNKILDSEELSEALDCSIDDAENALRLMLPELNKANA
jgi:hypothetical protein